METRASTDREPALDVARGLAVLAMIYMHLLPTVGRASALERVLTRLGRTLEGKSAVLFCVLAGISWSLQAQRSKGSGRLAAYVARRALSIGAVGLVLFVTAWGTEVLTPLALMMPLVFALRLAGRRYVALAAVVLLAAVPLATHLWGDYAWSDWNEDGTHLAEGSLGWVTLRFYLFDGNYPALPWLAFPLVGVLCVPLLDDPRRARRAFALALPLAIGAQVYAGWAQRRFAYDDELAMHLRSEWVPTSLPFVVLGLASAIAVISGLLALRQAAPGMLARLGWLAALGRASLTHYVLHVLAVFLPLRAAYPDEDWSVSVGARAFAVYVALAIPLSCLWFRRFRRGPLEALWAWVSGARR